MTPSRGSNQRTDIKTPTVGGKCTSTPNSRETVGPSAGTENTSSLMDDPTMSDNGVFNVTEEDSIVSVHTSCMNSSLGEVTPMGYNNLTLSGLCEIEVTPLKSQLRVPPNVNKSCQTSLTPPPKVKQEKIQVKYDDRVKNIDINSLTLLIRDIINNKSKPAKNRLEIFIKNILLVQLGLKPDIDMCGIPNLKKKVHRKLTSSGAAMIGGGYRNPGTPHKLKSSRKSINQMCVSPFVRNKLNLAKSKQLNHV
jgi:hypothetical protein